jgi:hypothetical protein
MGNAGGLPRSRRAADRDPAFPLTRRRIVARNRFLAGALMIAAVSVWGCETQQADVLGPDDGVDTPLLAKGGGGNGGGGKPGGGGGDQCNLTFSLENIEGNFLGNDVEPPEDPEAYVNKVDKVMVFGGETGWRFDTNGPNGWTSRDKRRVLIDNPSDNPSVAMDMRFDQKEGGLNFCDLDYTGANGSVSDTVPVVLTFMNKDGISTTWRYGGRALNNDDCGALNKSAQVTVTREGPDQWTLTSGDNACEIVSGDVVSVGLGVQKNFSFTVTRQ